ncbi:MAG: LacI family DNA-binding transcriptional regulator [bacterium]|nr:LacI family DNA-binding transcriptional regulator [bacterium]
MNHVTMKDIAAELGLSLATVSKAMNDKPDVSEKVKGMVRRVAEEKGYQQNYLASSLALSKPINLIGYIVPSADDLSTPRITKAVEDKIFINGYNMLLGQSNNEFEKERRLITDFIRKRVSGLVLIAAPGDENIEYYREVVRKVPVVFIDQHPGIEANCVLTNDKEVSRQAVEYLIGLGHRRILVLGGVRGAGTTEHRLEGCRLAVKNAGLKADALLGAQIGFQEDEAYGVLMKMEREGAAYSAVLCLSNRVACGAIRFFRDRGLAIPEDVSLIGFANNSDEGGVRSLPGCTIVRQPTYEYGEKALELLYKIIEDGNTGKYREVVLPSCLQTGNSTVPPSLRWR